MITPDFMKDVADYSPVDGYAPITPEDAALLVYTSGSTGNPKGVLIDHHALIDSVNRTLEFTEAAGLDVIGLGAPFFFMSWFSIQTESQKQRMKNRDLEKQACYRQPPGLHRQSPKSSWLISGSRLTSLQGRRLSLMISP